MASPHSDSMPKTANLLACKQWWKVCFLHGNQEKYYRQIYGRAAAQRLASSQRDDKAFLNEANSSLSNKSKIIFPTKQHSPVVIEHGTNDTIKLQDYENRRKQLGFDDPFVQDRRVVNILDDPFLFGIGESNENGSDSGIDANFTNKGSEKCQSSKGTVQNDNLPTALPPPRPPKSTVFLQNRV